MTRKLASIQRITRLTPIEGADKIEKADVLGWHVVVEKGAFKEGDLVCYCEVDSIMPEKPEFYFLQERHYRIRTIKLRKTVSQGIIFPLDIFASYGNLIRDKDNKIVGIEVNDNIQGDKCKK